MTLNDFLYVLLFIHFYTFNSYFRAEIMHRKLLEIRWLVEVHNMLIIIIMDEQYCGLEAQSSLEWEMVSFFSFLEG